MTLSMPDPPSAWDRTLPKPNAILQNLPAATFVRRSSSLLQHHLGSRILSQEGLENNLVRRSTVPCILYHESRPSWVDNGQTRLIDSISSGALLPSTALSPLMRKRDADQMAEESQSAPDSPSSATPGEGAKEFCLCQPDPKIPRPRNAFILYRQHQQAAVVAQHPGLPNPEISKIIGEQWRSLPTNSKNEWKALAEEEKARHQQQYPDYRYQPRRSGRYSNASSVSGASGSPSATVSEQGTCLKCFGKVMNPPNTPYTPYPPTNSDPPPPAVVAMHPPRRTYTVTTGPQNPRPQPNGATSPRSARARPYAEVFGRQPQHDPRLRYAGQPPPPTPLSPESNKRRRFNGHGVLIPGRGDMYSQSVRQYSAMERPLARPEVVQGPRTAMAPPRSAYQAQSGPLQMQQARPQPPQSSPPQMQQARTQFPPPQRDPSLVLPPLKTVAGTRSPPQTQKSGIEAMIKSMPALNKLKFLTQISPPLSNPSIASPPFEIRGAILAVEGLDPDSVWNMTNSLADQLEKDGNFAVRIFSGPDPYESIRKSRGSNDEKPISMENFLALIGQWHKISKELIEYITTKPKVIHFNDTELERPADHQDTHMTGASTHPVPDSAVSPRTMSKAADLSLASPMSKLFGSGPTPTNENLIVATSNPPERTSPRRTPPAPPPTSSPPGARIPSPAHSAANPNPSPAPKSHHTSISSSNLIPIAIIPHYQLTTVDANAVALPITDAYSPPSHWQWLATLFRGCVGPDVSVVVEDVNEAMNPRSSVSGSGEGSVPEGVEVRLQDARAIVVRLGLDARALDGEGWEKAKRRVGFEVEEFLRQ